MCDTIIAVPPATADGCIWFGKNSDREPGEAQLVEHLPRRIYSAAAKLACTYLAIPQAAQTHEIIISRPFWMWGAEMGANEHGLAIGNEAVFTRLPYAKSGLTGMDLLRLALERAVTAREALDLITYLIAQHGQGGACGYRNQKFRYHNSFIIADPQEAWVLETADRFWVAERVRGIRTISNVLTIGRRFDLISDEAYPFARSRGWCSSADDFDFARCFGDPKFSRASGGDERRACTFNALHRQEGRLELPGFIAALRDHAGLSPDAGWRMKMPCAHASWWPTRAAGQTTGSMISCLRAGAAHSSQHWLTGTSAPCLSVFKPVSLGGELLQTGPAPGAGYDDRSLFWRHEKLHRLALRDYEQMRPLIDELSALLETRISQAAANNPQEHWNEHLSLIPEWTSIVAKEQRATHHRSLFHRYWLQQSQLDSVPSV